MEHCRGLGIMNGDLKDVQAPSHRECLLPAVAHTPSVTRVTPAKKVTFLKRGDPRFAGVRLAVHRRTFKTFSALMDELSQRVPLSFGVRSVTTPRGLHGLSALEQLQDGGCYLCSDRKAPKTPRGPGRPQGGDPSAVQSRDVEGGREAPGTSSSCRGPAALRKVTLVRNGDTRHQQTLLLSHKDARSRTAFLSQASELLRFPVKQVYTISGRKVDPLQVLLRGPSVLVCAGNEAFKPLVMDSAQRGGTEALSVLTSSNKNGYWGPKAKPSVIHSRSRSGSRHQSLPSARSGLSKPPASLPRAWMGTSPPGPLVTGDDVEKKVRMNEDGSLSVEMRVRLHLPGEEAMLWSQRVGQASREGPGLQEVDPDCCRWEGHRWDSLESGARGPGLCEAGCQRAFDGSLRPWPSCEIWRNPLCVPQGEKPAPQRRSAWGQGRKRCGKERRSPASSAERPEGSDPDSCSPRTPEGCAGSDSPCLASEATSPSWAEQKAGEAQSPEGGQPAGCEPQSYQAPGTRGVEGALSDSLASAKSHEESGKWGGQQWGCPGQERSRTSQRKATQGDSPCLSSPNNEELPTEKRRQGSGCHEAMDGPVTTPPLALGSSGSWDTGGISLPLSACAPALQGRRRWQSPGSTTASPSTLNPHQVAQRGHARLCPHCKDTHCPTDFPEAQLAPRPPDRGDTCPRGPVPRCSPKSSSTSRQASGNARSLYTGSLDPKDSAAASRVATPPVSSSDCASSLSHPRACSAEPVGDTACKVHFSPPTPSRTRGAGSRGGQTGSTSRPSPPLALLGGWPEEEEPGARHSCCSSQAGACPVLGTPSGHTEACWACGGYCPTPPRGQPCTKRYPLNCGGHQRAADEGPGAGGTGEETLQVGRRLSPSPKPGAMQRAVRGAGRSPSPGAGTGISEEPREDGSVTPSALPHASPDAVVREWLDNIPEEPALLRYEVVDESTPVAHDSLGGAEEDARDLRQQVPEEDPDEHTAQDQGLRGAVDVGPKLGDDPHQGTGLGEVPEAAAKAGIGEGAPTGRAATRCALPGRVSASAQILKALMGSKQGRPSSLPELSGPMVQRLSRSAEALIACLVRLRFFDDALGSLADKGRFEDSPQYQELLGLSQGLWPGCDLGQGQLDLDFKELTACQALPVTKDLTPTSSSGVDVSSGSGGSGDSSVPCAVDATLVPEQLERSLQLSSQRPNARSSGHPEHRADPQQSCLTASSSSPVQEEATSNSREQTSGHDPEQTDNSPEPLMENTTREDRGQTENTEERERPQEEAVPEEGLPGEARVSGEQEDTGNDPASAALGLPGRGEEPTERHLSQGGSDASENHGSPRSEPGLEAPPRAAALGWEQVRAQSTPDTGVTSLPGARSVTLDPDPVWVSKLLTKMEEAFMAHLAGALAELRARWSLQDDSLLDQMVAELQRDVGLRLRDSTNKELRKIQSRAGRSARGSPREALRGQASLPAEQRRRRLQGLRNLSAFPEQSPNWEPLFPTLEDRPNLSAALGTGLGAGAEGDEFCPCETCMRKKALPKSPKDTAGAASAPIKIAFDLRQILQQRRREAAEGAPERTGTERPREDPTVQGGGTGGQKQALGPGSQRQSSGPKLGETEGAGDQEREKEVAVRERGGRTHASVGSTREEEAEGLENRSAEQEGATRDGSGDGDAPPEAAGEQGSSAEAAGQPQSEEGHDGEKEGGPGVSTGQGGRGEALGSSSLDQEGRPMTPPAQAGDAPHQGPGPQTPLGCCSQVSRKALEDQSGRDLGCLEAPQTKGKVTTMYPASEEGGSPSDPGTPEPGADLSTAQANGNFKELRQTWRICQRPGPPRAIPGDYSLRPGSASPSGKKGRRSGSAVPWEVGDLRPSTEHE
ncbi:PREDICTED: retinitis pigmentosa 1-like 1 protein [Chinchilla lanigera]|uniref:retinitis pigmentosa 1-like 1 protein n=1 Tax=Chinchilla lanigera TaxID=34839 RepID=UPI00069661F8|nr:PREDICTED: retinitis pigmentosa 1-like 1 protein [Chinchilla lanigera]